MDSKANKTCRVCLRFGNEFEKTCKSLFEVHNNEVILKYVTLIADVKIQEGDGFPTKICSECLAELDAAIYFKHKCEKSNRLLQDLASEISEIIEPVKSASSPIPQPSVPVDFVKKEDERYDQSEYPIDVEFELNSEEVQDNQNYEESSVKIEYILEEVTLDDSEPAINKSTPAVIRKSKAKDLKLICDSCGGSFKSKCKLRVHWKKVHKHENLICQYCNRTFKSHSAHQKHLNMRPINCILASQTRIEGVGKSRVLYCKDCNFHSKTPHDFRNHLNIHTGDRPHVCKLCSKAFAQQSSLDSHSEVVHKIIKKIITCQYCGERVVGRHNIVRHLSKHTRTSVQCDFCKKMFKSKSILAEHMKHHTGIRNFNCEICSVGFYTYPNLQSHIRQVHETNKMSHKCDACGRYFKSKCSLKRHTGRHTDFNVSCDLCGRFYPNTELMEIHRKVHTKEKSLCIECNRLFSNERCLRRHKLRIHTPKVKLGDFIKVRKKNSKSLKACKDENILVEILPFDQ